MEMYWRSEMDGEIPILALPTDRPRPARQTSRGATHGVKIPASLSAALRDLAQAKGHTLFTLLVVSLRCAPGPLLGRGRYRGRLADDRPQPAGIAGRRRLLPQYGAAAGRFFGIRRSPSS